MLTLANTQAFQSVYINPKAENWKDRIIFHDPIFQDEISGVIALKSYRLEDCLGFVLNAPISRIRYFRNEVNTQDNEHEWGRLEPDEILNKLVLLIKEIGGTITYLQNKTKEAPKEKIEGDKPKGTFKPKKIKKGKSIGLLKYLAGYSRQDRIIPTTEKEVCIADRRIYSPGVGVYPEEIIPYSKEVWNNLLYTISSEIYKEEDTYTRWQIALYGFDKKCDELNLNPYKIVCNDVLKIKENMLYSLHRAKKEIFSVYHIFDNDGVVGNISKFKIENICSCDNNILVHGSYKFKLKEDLDIEMPMVRNLDERTHVAFDVTANTIVANMHYTLPVSESQKITGAVSTTKLIHSFYNYFKNGI